MKRTSKNIGLTLAAAAAALLATGCSSLCGEVDTSVKCTGVNACKGSSHCATPDSSCKGHNECKGSGWTYMSKEECLRNGGEAMY